MKNRIKQFSLLGLILVLCFLLLSCGKEEVIFTEPTEPFQENTQPLERDLTVQNVQPESESTSQSTQPEGASTSWNAQSAEGFSSSQSTQPEGISSENLMSGKDMQKMQEPEGMMIHVCGAVQNPGVYELEEGSRIADAVTAAGGFLKEADEEYVNLATRLQDGSQVKIPTKDETAQMSKDEMTKNDNCVTLPSVMPAATQMVQENPEDGLLHKVNINTADKEQLCTLPGIGPTRAEGIIAYRNSQGAFSKIEDIMLVSGIKESSFQKIKNYITIK